jgi:hypothetical protein
VLHELLNVPASFVAEVVVSEPRLLCLSANTLRSKFDALVLRYGPRAG